MAPNKYLFSQTGDGVPPARSEPTTPRRQDEKSTSNDKLEVRHAKVEKQEDFADFSRFESFVEAQDGGGVIRRGSSPRPAQHRRSFSLDHSRVRLLTSCFCGDNFGFTH